METVPGMLRRAAKTTQRRPKDDIGQITKEEYRDTKTS